MIFHKINKYFIVCSQSTMALVNETNEMGSQQSLENRSRIVTSPSGEWQNGSTRNANILNALTSGPLLQYIIIDLSKVTFIDTVGAKILKQVRKLVLFYSNCLSVLNWLFQWLWKLIPYLITFPATNQYLSSSKGVLFWWRKLVFQILFENWNF